MAEAALTLKHRILRAGSWTLAGFGVSQVLRLASNLIMTRMLVPEVFGVMAIATVLMVGLTMFSDLGLKQSIVRSSRGAEPEFLNTAWAVQILRGISLAVAGIGASVVLLIADRVGLTVPGTAYADPHLPVIVAVLAVGAAISGFESTKQFEASRRLNLGRLTGIGLASQVVSLSVMFAWAAIDRSIWAIVAGNVTAIVVRAVLTHVALDGVRNVWRWDSSAFQEIVGFGKWIFLASLLGFCANSADRLIIGGFVSSHVLGIYVIAFFVMNALEQLLVALMSDVSFPSLSEVAREQPNKLREAYYRFRFVIGSVANFAAGFLFLAGQSVIDLLYDARYVSAGWMLKTLSVCLLTVQFQLCSQCFMALGQSAVLSKLSAIRAGAVALFIPFGFYLFGLAGGVWAVVLTYVSWLPAALYFKAKFGLLDLKEEARTIPSLIAGLIAGCVVLYA